MSISSSSTCLVISNGSYSFIGYQVAPSLALLLEIIAILKANKPIKLLFHSGLLPLLPFESAGFRAVARMQFHNPSLLHGDTSTIDTICASIPADLKVKAFNKELLQQSNWQSYIKLFYGSEEHFLKTGFGLALVKDEKIISEAFACYIGGGYCETGSITAEEYRGQGYATLIRAFLIRKVLQRGMQPISSCDTTNLASIKASKKLGYVEEIGYQFLRL